MGPYCRQYKSTVCFFFPWLPNCSTKIICVLLYMLWVCNGHQEAYYVSQCNMAPSVHYSHNAWIAGPEFLCLGIIHLFLKKMNQAHGRWEKEEADSAFELSAIRTQYWFNVLPIDGPDYSN
jgi:hypothetical protein